MEKIKKRGQKVRRNVGVCLEPIGGGKTEQRQFPLLRFGDSHGSPPPVGNFWKKIVTEDKNKKRDCRFEVGPGFVVQQLHEDDKAAKDPVKEGQWACKVAQPQIKPRNADCREWRHGSPVDLKLRC